MLHDRFRPRSVRRQRIRAVCPLVHEHPCQRPEEQDRGGLRQPPLLAGADDPAQSALQEKVAPLVSSCKVATSHLVWKKSFEAPKCASSSGDPSLQLHQHQLDAITLANQGKSFVVTTGTGSGKSLCFFIPIIDQILRAKAKGEPQRTRAIVIYPMNALANSQMEELDKRIAGSGYENKVIFKRYTGQDDEEARERIRASAPDILLTNFMMLELLLTRQSRA